MSCLRAHAGCGCYGEIWMWFTAPLLEDRSCFCASLISSCPHSHYGRLHLRPDLQRQAACGVRGSGTSAHRGHIRSLRSRPHIDQCTCLPGEDIQRIGPLMMGKKGKRLRWLRSSFTDRSITCLCAHFLRQPFTEHHWWQCVAGEVLFNFNFSSGVAPLSHTNLQQLC